MEIDFALPADEAEVQTLKQIYSEIWDDEEYTRFGLDIKRGDIVVDLGANIGFFSVFAHVKGASKVIAVECESKYFELLKINTEFYNITPVYNYISPFYNVSHIIDEFKLERINFLKIDIEGDEYDLLENISENTLSKIDQISIEFHLWGLHNKNPETMVKMIQIMEKLSKNGFKLNLEHIHKRYQIIMVYAKKV